MRSIQSWAEVEQQQTVKRAYEEVLGKAPNTALARSGVLYNVSHDNPDTPYPTDETGEPVPPAGYFRIGMRLGSLPIKKG